MSSSEDKPVLNTESHVQFIKNLDNVKKFKNAQNS
jgi:hypothetical protein